MCIIKFYGGLQQVDRDSETCRSIAICPDILNRWSLTFPIIIRQKATHFSGPMQDRRFSCWRDSSSCRNYLFVRRPLRFCETASIDFKLISNSAVTHEISDLDFSPPSSQANIHSRFAQLSQSLLNDSTHIKGLETEYWILEIEFYLLK